LIAVWLKPRSTKIGGGADAPDADRRLPAPALDLAAEPGAAHQPLDALAADADAVLEAQLGMHARRPVSLARVGVDLRDSAGQALVLDRPRRRFASRPGVTPSG
jgi:hypothetical protein